jgi:D-3-phosphoglycerate dehydrogenase
VAHSVLIAEKIADPGIELLEGLFDVTTVPGWNAEELAEHIGDFDAVVVRSATKLTAELIGQAERLKVIGRAGVGVDNVDLAAASQRGIVVVNAPTSTIITVAEHTLALMLALARNVARGDATMRQGEWSRSKLGGVELCGKTLVLLGLGRIGQAVAERSRALGMRVVGYDPFVARDRFAALGVEYAATIREAVAQADVISLHMPLTDETRGMVGPECLEATQPGARLINTARGALVDLDALDAALESGQLAGAALDVYPTEPPPAHPLFARENILLTPHLAASTREAQDRAGVFVAEQVAAALAGGVVTTAVNVPSIAAEDVEALQPFMPLAGRLGRLAFALAGQGAMSTQVQVVGAIADFDPRMIELGALIGLLGSTSDDPVTLVNAHQIAERRGLEVDTSVERQVGDFNNLVRIALRGGERDIEVAGTTIGADHRPWLTEVFGFHLEIELTPHMALFVYDDVPGMIGRIGSAFGSEGVNIANMAVSRNEGRAIMALSFDAQPPPATVERLASGDSFELGVSIQL